MWRKDLCEAKALVSELCIIIFGALYFLYKEINSGGANVIVTVLRVTVAAYRLIVRLNSQR